MSAVSVQEATTEAVAQPASISPPDRLAIYCARPLIAAGLTALVAGVRTMDVTDCAGLDDLMRILRDGVRAVIVDGSSPGADLAAGAGHAFLATVVVIVDHPESPLSDDTVEAASAILLRDEIDEPTLAIAATAASHGLRLCSQSVVIRQRPEGARLALISDREVDALELLAGGCRDAEIAAILSLSEGAARKLVQRAVQRLGARTRCEAVSIALAAGYLT